MSIAAAAAAACLTCLVLVLMARTDLGLIYEWFYDFSRQLNVRMYCWRRLRGRLLGVSRIMPRISCMQKYCISMFVCRRSAVGCFVLPLAFGNALTPDRNAACVYT